MNSRFQMPFLAVLLCLSFSACDSANTTITEKDPLVGNKPDDHDHGHAGEGEGRLVVISSVSPTAEIYDLEDNSLVDAFSLELTPSAVQASAGYRYAVLVNRTADQVNFLDGGLWQEAHLDHFDSYEEAPRLLNYGVSGSRPTHLAKYEGHMAIFYDGDAATTSPASVQVLKDADIASENASPAEISYMVNMHGVALPRGEFLLASVRRADANSTSTNPVLPDQVGVYHWHDGGYAEEEIFSETCADLHGAAQNENHVVFGCADGVLLVDDVGGVFVASKIANPAELATDLRVGTLYGHEHSEQFIGLASAHGGAVAQWVSVDPAEGEIHLIDWQPMAGARPLSHGFSFDGERFLVLDSQGYLTIFAAHDHDGHMEWEQVSAIDISEENPADMPEGLRFNMTIAQNGNYAYIADPVAQHIVIVDLEDGDLVDEIELSFAPAFVTWLGIAETHDH